MVPLGQDLMCCKNVYWLQASVFFRATRRRALRDFVCMEHGIPGGIVDDLNRASLDPVSSDALSQ